jgi:hypothetical protein
MLRGEKTGEYRSRLVREATDRRLFKWVVGVILRSPAGEQGSHVDYPVADRRVRPSLPCLAGRASRNMRGGPRFANAMEDGMRTHEQDGIAKVWRGITDIRQMRAVCMRRRMR